MSVLRIKTYSGSEYMLDLDAMTYERRNASAPILGYEHRAEGDITKGTLMEVPDPQIGYPAVIWVDDGQSIITTPVISFWVDKS